MNDVHCNCVANKKLQRLFILKVTTKMDTGARKCIIPTRKYHGNKTLTVGRNKEPDHVGGRKREGNRIGEVLMRRESTSGAGGRATDRPPLHCLLLPTYTCLRAGAD